MNIKPMADYILASRPEVETETKSGLVIPTSAQEQSNILDVIKVGKNIKEIKPKDKIMCKSYDTTSVVIDKKEYIILQEKDVIARVES